MLLIPTFIVDGACGIVDKLALQVALALLPLALIHRLAGGKAHDAMPMAQAVLHLPNVGGAAGPGQGLRQQGMNADQLDTLYIIALGCTLTNRG